MPGARGEHGAHQLGHELRVGARRVHRAELDVVGELARAPHHGGRHRDDLRAGLLELMRELHVARVHEHVDAARAGVAQRLAGGRDVLRHRPRQRADRGAAHVRGDLGDRGALLRRVHREARLDHVHAERREPRRDLELVARREADAGRLLAVAQRGVEDEDTFGHGSLREAAGTERARVRTSKHETLSGRLRRERVGFCGGLDLSRLGKEEGENQVARAGSHDGA